MWGSPQKSFFKICYYEWLGFKIFMWQKEYIQSLQGRVGRSVVCSLKRTIKRAQSSVDPENSSPLYSYPFSC